jgi:hypothetical protein
MKKTGDNNPRKDSLPGRWKERERFLRGLVIMSAETPEDAAKYLREV